MSLTNYWETYDRSYDEFEKEGFNLDDVLAKTKFAFGGKYTFSSKSKFNFGAKTSASHEYGLKRKCEHAQIDFKHKDKGETSIEADVKAFKKDDVKVNVYSKVVVDQGADRCNSNVTAMLRVHHKDNALVSFGVENWKACQGSPSTLTAYGSFGKVKDGAKLSANGYVNLDLKTKFVPLVRFLATAQKGDVRGYFQANLNRAQVETDDSEKKTVVNQTVDVVAKVIKDVDAKTKVGGVFDYNLENKQMNAAIVGSKVIDKVRLNARLSTDRSLSAGITSAYDDITLGFAAKANLNSVTEKVGEADHTRHYATYKFGLSAEFNRV